VLKRSIWVLVILFVGVGYCLAASPFDDYPALMDTLVAGDYGSANTIAAQIQSDYPGHPVALLALCAVRAFHAADVTGSSDINSVLSLLDSTAKTAEAYKARPGEDQAELSLVRGAALFGRGVILCRLGKLFKGVPEVFRARSEIGHVIDLKPDLYDAYLGRGAFRFVKVIFLSKFDPFHLVSSPEAAKSDLMMAVEHGKFGHYLGMATLAWVSPKQHEYAFADSLCEVGLQRFPRSRTFLWPLSFSKEAQHAWGDLERICLDLVEQYQKIPEDNGLELTWLYDRLTTAADSLGRPADALNYAKTGCATKRTDRTADLRSDEVRRLTARVKKG
jgi:hypothetical protein